MVEIGDERVRFIIGRCIFVKVQRLSSILVGFPCLRLKFGPKHLKFRS